MRHNTFHVAHDTGGPLRRGGFSLIEITVATAIIGIGVVALLICVSAGTSANYEGRRLTQATFLAQEIREWTLRLPFSDPDPEDEDNPPGSDSSDPQIFVDDLDDLMDITFSPPRDGMGLDIYDMSEWSETITMTWRSPTDLAATVTPGTSNVIHVELKLYKNGLLALTTGWIVVRRDQP